MSARARVASVALCCVTIGGVASAVTRASARASQASTAAPRKLLPPVDEASRDPELAAVSPFANRDDRSPAVIDGHRYAWLQIVTPSGRTGWVCERYARTATHARLAFRKIDGHWKLVSFAVGD